MNTTLQQHIVTNFIWLPHLGYGYYPAIDLKTDYFDQYQAYEGSESCDQLNHIRAETVDRHITPLGDCLDFGIGAGTFIKKRGIDTMTGYDRDARGVQWLIKNNVYRDPYSVTSIANISFWDAFEHVEHPEVILSKVTNFVFMSIPIFESVDHVLQSKHYKVNEHFWYFTKWGLEKWMNRKGFDCLEFHTKEVEAGREDVGTFVFKRKSVAA